MMRVEGHPNLERSAQGNINCKVDRSKIKILREKAERARKDKIDREKMQSDIVELHDRINILEEQIRKLSNV